MGKKFFDIINQANNSDDHMTYREKIDNIKGKHEGEDCYILTCGPNLKNYSKEFLKEKLKGKKVIAVKQAYEHCPEIVDYHLFNSNNFQRYDYGKDKPYVVAVSGDYEPYARKEIWGHEQYYDIFLPMRDNCVWEEALCNTFDFKFIL